MTTAKAIQLAGENIHREKREKTQIPTMLPAMFEE